jgi:hypothetical protein
VCLLQHPDGGSGLPGREPGQRDAERLLGSDVQRREPVEVCAGARLRARAEREAACAQQHLAGIGVALQRAAIGGLGIQGAAQGLERLAEGALRLGIAGIDLHRPLQQRTGDLGLAPVEQRHAEAPEAGGVAVQVGERLHRAHRIVWMARLERHLRQQEIWLLLARGELARPLQHLAGALRPIGLVEQPPEEEQRRDVVRPALEESARGDLCTRRGAGPGLGLGEREHQLGTAWIRGQGEAQLLDAQGVLALQREHPGAEEVGVGRRR